MAARLVKYMGTADVCRLAPGEDFGGRLAEPLTREVRFNKDNRWVIDTEKAGMSDEAVELLLEDKERFKDVTDLKKVPTNAHQRTFMAMGLNEADGDAERARAAATGDDASLVAEGDAQRTSGGTDAATTAGGSGDDAGATAGTGTGGTTRGGRGART